MNFQHLLKDRIFALPIIRWIFEGEKFKWAATISSVEKTCPLMWAAVDEVLPHVHRRVREVLKPTTNIFVSSVGNDLWISFSRPKQSSFDIKMSFASPAITFVIDKKFDVSARIP